MTDPIKATHKALLAALQTACSCSIYDAVPQEASFPYVVIGEEASGNEDFLNARMDRRFIYLSIWSRAHGSAEVRDIVVEIQALNESPLTLDNGTLVSLRVERVLVNREPDNLTFMGHVTLRLLTLH